MQTCLCMVSPYADSEVGSLRTIGVQSIVSGVPVFSLTERQT